MTAATDARHRGRSIEEIDWCLTQFMIIVGYEPSVLTLKRASKPT